MRSWVLLLLLLSAALLRLGNAEGDPLPPSLVDLVRNSPISSVDDLKLLLQQEANAIEEEDEHDTLADHTHGRYARSLMEAQPAQQAVCKVRTEVMEVKRSMLDRRNANFMLWPPCVEVQRCSGCCNNRLMQCVPIVTSSRYLQVIKIQYVNMKPKYEKAIITVEDHVSCMCQASTSSSSSSSSSASNTRSSQSIPLPASPQQPPPSLSHSQGLPRSVQPGSQKPLTSKADLHRHDDLKHNQQRYHPEEQPVAKQRQQGTSAHWTQPRLHQSPAHAQPGVYQHAAGGPALVSSQQPEAGAEPGVTKSTPQVMHGSGYDGSVHGTKRGSGVMHHPDHMQRQQELLQHQQRQQLQPRYPQPTTDEQVVRTQSHLSAPQSDSAASPPVSPTQTLRFEQTCTPPTLAYQKESATSEKYAELAQPRVPEAVTTSQKEGKDREESGSSSSGDMARVELKDRDSNISSGSGHLTEEERKQKILETVQRELDKQSHLHPHPPQQRPRPTFKSALPTAAPRQSSRRSPFRPASPRRRRRKHRKRISKEAMRAMIM